MLTTTRNDLSPMTLTEEQSPKAAEPPPGLADPIVDESYRGMVRAFHAVAEALTDVDQDLDTLLHLVAAKICELVGVRRCSIYLKDEKSDLFHGQIAHASHDID